MESTGLTATTVLITVGTARVTVLAGTPMQEQALVYRTAPEQAVAYAAMLKGDMTGVAVGIAGALVATVTVDVLFCVRENVPPNSITDLHSGWSKCLDHVFRAIS